MFLGENFISFGGLTKCFWEKRANPIFAIFGDNNISIVFGLLCKQIYYNINLVPLLVPLVPYLNVPYFIYVFAMLSVLSFCFLSTHAVIG